MLGLGGKPFFRTDNRIGRPKGEVLNAPLGLTQFLPVFFLAEMRQAHDLRKGHRSGRWEKKRGGGESW